MQKQGAVCEMRGYMEERLQVGVIASTHGVHGEVKIFPTTDDVRRFKKLKEVILDTGKENRILEIESVKFFKQFAILKFRGIDTIDEAEKYRRKSLYVTRENAVRLQKDEYFIADLIGVKVLDEQEQELGTLEDVIETGANDVYQIRLKDGRQLLLPAIKECVLDVDVEAGRMKIHILDGLLEDRRKNAVSYFDIVSGNGGKRTADEHFRTGDPKRTDRNPCGQYPRLHAG